MTRCVGLAGMLAWTAWSAEPPAGLAATGAELVEVRRIWDQAPHSAFTDLARYAGRMVCVFREGATHADSMGVIRVIESEDGAAWESGAVLAMPDHDLRDPKLSVTPEGDLMLTAASSLKKARGQRHDSWIWLSPDGRRWSAPIRVGQRNVWAWRVGWHEEQAYAVGYATRDPRFTRLYRLGRGWKYRTHVRWLFTEGYSNEAAMTFLPDETFVCLLRRDGSHPTAQLGIAKPPYVWWKWKWTDTGVRIGGPQILRLPDGRIVAATRRYDGGVRTSLQWLDVENAGLTEFLVLPSGGDTSYPGMVWHGGLLWISYYSSHEDKTAIYLAKVRLAP